MATWPATLPTFSEILSDSYSEIFPNNVIRTEMELGPAKLRKRGTAAPQVVAGNFFMTSTQVGILRTFYEDTISYGATEFDTIHPRTSAVISAQFMGQPQIARMGDGWSVNVVIEVLP